MTTTARDARATILPAVSEQETACHVIAAAHEHVVVLSPYVEECSRGGRGNERPRILDQAQQGAAYARGVRITAGAERERVQRCGNRGRDDLPFVISRPAHAQSICSHGDGAVGRCLRVDDVPWFRPRSDSRSNARFPPTIGAEGRDHWTRDWFRTRGSIGSTCRSRPLLAETLPGRPGSRPLLPVA